MDLSHLRGLFQSLGHKWDLAIIGQLAEHPLRYSELAQKIREIDSELTDGVLSKNLKRLAANGLVRQDTIGRRNHTYALTARGRYIVSILAKITEFDDGTRSSGGQERDDFP